MSSLRILDPMWLISLIVKVNTAASASGCAYPDHAIPVCGSGTCGFSCGDGFSVSGDACVCAAPNIVCNGEFLLDMRA